LAEAHGIKSSLEGVEALLKSDCEIVFEATSAKSHLANAPLFEKAGKIAVDLTPAAVGPYVIPAVNLGAHLDKRNVNLITCGGQATIPIMAAISRVTKIHYGEIVASIASKSAGPGTRQNIDEFTQTTARGIEVVGGALRGKAIIVLNPAEPPITMRDTVHALVENPDKNEITRSVEEMVKIVQKYVPGYHLKLPPWFDGNRITVILEIEGAGDYLPKYSGNLDIMTSAAAAVGEGYAKKILAAG
jgi:acetaldehyde dehydrogenase